APERAAELRTHLEGCALCAEVRTSLEDIRETLGRLPGPVRMPLDIAGRIDAALAAEAVLSASPSTESGARVSRETASAHRIEETTDNGNADPQGDDPVHPHNTASSRHPSESASTSPPRSVSRETGDSRPHGSSGRPPGH